MRPSREAVLMQSAALWALRSTCIRAQVGCVVARDGRSLVNGYNGAPAGMPHCEHPEDETNIGVGGGVRSSGKIIEGCRISVHAEANAVAYAARLGIRLEGAEMYTTLSPCVMCAMLIINVGIKVVYAAQIYRDPAGVELLGAAGIYTQSLTP